MSATQAEPEYGTSARPGVREKLILAAESLFASAPPGDVTAKQIAQEAGVNHGQIHHYFGSKDGLIAATLSDDQGQYRIERRGDAQSFPDTLDANYRASAWRTLAYVAASGTWRQPPFEPSPVVKVLAEQRAADVGARPTDTPVLADVAAALALQRGWWIFRDIIETALGEFDPDIAAIRSEVTTRSSRLFDESIPLGAIGDEVAQPSLPAIDGTPRGRDQVRASLMSAAIELLAEHAPSKVTTKQIAAHAGVNHGQVHHYFASKQHLIAQSIRHAADPLVQAIESSAIPSPVPIRTERRLSIWRTLAHIASTEEWVDEAYERAPVVRKNVEIVASRLDKPTTATTVHAQVAVVHALELGWAVYRNIIEYGITAIEGDVHPVRKRLAAMSCRLVDDAVRVNPKT